MVIDRYALLAFAFPLALAAGAQSITLLAPGNVPVAGGEFLVKRGPHAVPVAGGAGMFFDFNSLTSTASNTYKWESPASLPNGAQFPNAQVALTNGGADTLFYAPTTDGVERVGDTQTITVFGTPYHFAAPYANNVLELKLPLTYGNAWTDSFDGTFTVDGQSASRTGSIQGDADAWGYIVLPGGADTLAVLRVTTRLTETITIASIPFPINHVRNVSAFIPLWAKFPVFRTVSDSLSAQILDQNYAYTEWLDAGAVGIADADLETTLLHVFPNPATEQVTVVFASGSNGSFDVQVIDARGAVVLNQRTTGRTMDLNVSKWDAGQYQVVLTHPNGRRSVSPLVVTH